MELVQKYQELATSEEPVYFISHGDCLADAKQLETLIREETGRGQPTLWISVLSSALTPAPAPSPYFL